MPSRLLPDESPTGLATYTLKVNGQPLARRYGVLALNVSKELNRIPKASLTLLDGDPAGQEADGAFPVSNESTFLPGNELEIWLGLDGTEDLVFKGILVRHALRIRADRAPELTLEARDIAVKSNQTRRCRYFNDQKDSEILETILGEYGLDATVAPTDETHAGLVQYHATDWDFMLTRAEANGLLCFVSDGTVVVGKPDLSQEPVLELTFGASILELDAELDARHQPESVEAQGWNPADQSRQNLPAAEPEFSPAGNVTSSDLAGALGQSETLRHGGNLTEPGLQAWADARLQRARLSGLRGRVRFIGCRALNPGELITLAGLSDRFNGTVLVSGVRHTLNTSEGWLTDVQFGLSPDPFAREAEPLAAPAAGGLLPPVRGLHVGVVTALEDPDGAYRVKVRMPAVSADEEGVWARMALLDAGANRGTLFRPEVGDEVVVGFFDEDPRFPVVLGGLHSPARAAPLEPADSNHHKAIVTRSGMKIGFDDEKKILTLETPAGKKILLDENAGTLELRDEHRNKVTLSSSGIVIQSGGDLALRASSGTISLQAAQLSLSANASLSVKATGALQLESSATATLKGAMVMIN